MIVSLKIQNCRECPHSTNSAKLHDDPFTSGPSTITWFCQAGKKPSSVIVDSYEIDKDCPLKAKKDE